MGCPVCGHEPREGARFCDACGRRLETSCPACGQPARAGARFCDACGAALMAAAAEARTVAGAPARSGLEPRPPVAYTPQHLVQRILADAHALRGQRKEVTVLFVDVQGSTDLAAAVDPEEFHGLMDGAFGLMLDAVHRWEGTVNQFTGDGIMALFGAPIAHEDHARRALAAALDIRRGFVEYAARLRRDRGLTLQVRLGLNSGPVVVGAIGDDLRMDYTAQGLTTNLAARMQQAADPGSILVALATQRLGEGYFRFRAIGPLRIRGVAEAVEAHVLEGEGSVVTRLEASLRRGASPLRGREAELGRLGETWQRVSQGRGEAICLVGEPGIGKSRLVHEFRLSLGVGERIEGAALSHARDAPYFAVRPLLRQLAGIDDGADLASVRDHLRRRLWDLAPGLADQAPEILSVLGAAAEARAPREPGEAEDPRDRLRAAVSAWIAAECQETPRLLVIEDVHWLDPSSEDLLRHLAADARGLRLMLLLTSRLPLAGRPLELAGVRELPLVALPADDVHALVDAQVEPYPASARLREMVAARTEGNPFYVEELVRALRERGDLVLDDGRYDLRDPAASVVVPATISALIASRVDRLPASARELLADAAVLGRHVPLAHLRALAAGERVDEDLAQLERRDFLGREPGGPVVSLAFRHVLTQEVVYGTLLQPERHVRHRRVAEMLERLYRGRTEEVCDQLAHHWGRSDRRAAAVPYLLAAADGAGAVGASREAIGHLESALDLATGEPGVMPGEQVAAIRLKLAGLHYIVGER